MTDSARSPACAASAVSGPRTTACSGTGRPPRARGRRRWSSRRRRRPGRRTSSTARCGSGTSPGRTACRRGRRRCRRTRPPGPAAGSSARSAPSRASGAPAGIGGAACPRRMTNDEQRDVEGPEDRGHPAWRGRRAGPVGANAATATRTIPTAPSSRPLPSRTVGNAASRTTASASAVPSAASGGVAGDAAGAGRPRWRRAP